MLAKSCQLKRLDIVATIKLMQHDYDANWEDLGDLSCNKIRYNINEYKSNAIITNEW